MLGLAEPVEEAEVHNGLQVAVDFRQLGVLLPGSCILWLRHPGLAHRIEIGIFRVERPHPFGHALAVGVGIGVHADTVNTGRLNPPLTVLNEIAHEMRVALVEVGHRLDKPSVDSLRLIHFRRVGIEYGSELVGSLQAIVGIVEPVFRWRVEIPGMVVAAMIEYHVHHHLQTTLVAFVDELLIFSIGAEAGIHLIIIGGGIAMIRTVHAVVVGPVVLQDGSEPQSRNTKLSEVVKMLLYSGEVASVAQAGLGAVACLVAHAFHHVVFRIAVGEAVGHEQIEHVCIAEANVFLTTHRALAELVFHLFALAGLLEIECHLAGLRALQVEIDEEIVGRVEAHHAVDTRTGIVNRHVGRLDVGAVDHQLQRRVPHAGKPVGGVDAADLHLSISHDDLCENKE